MKNALGMASVSRAGNQPVICGKFIKISDTEYILEDYGSIVIEGSSYNAYSLQITPEGGETTTVAAQKSSAFSDSKINDAICRTWDINNIGVKLNLNNSNIYSGSKPASQLDVLLDEANRAWMNYFMSHFGADADEFEPYEPIGFYPVKAIFTKAGTYMVEYSNETVAVSTWHWIDEEKGQLQFSWDYGNPDSSEIGVGGSQNFVSFNGDRFQFREYHSDSDDGVTISTESIYDMTMAR